MNRVRLIVREISIQKKGEVNFFNIRFPNNVLRILGIETDVFITSPYTLPSAGGTGAPPLQWTAQKAVSVGKLKLQSPGREGLFFETWVTLIPYGNGLPDMSFGLIPIGSLTIDRKQGPKLLNLPCGHLQVEGMYEDDAGTQQGQDISYTLKLFLWVETSEAGKGLAFEFDDQKAGNEKDNLQLLQIKM